MKTYLVLFFSISFLSLHAQINLNGTWKFKTDLYQQGKTQGWYQENWSANAWDSLRVPGNWDLENEYAHYLGTAWYRRSFELSPTEGKFYFLKGESIYYDSEIWINGKKVGEHHFGFLPFEFEISKYLKDGPNTIAIAVSNRFKRGAIWNWGGIRRPIWIEESEALRVVEHQVKSELLLEKGEAKVEVSLSIANYSDQVQEVELTHSLAYAGKTLAQEAQASPIRPNSTQEISFRYSLDAEDTHAWHVHHPHLYDSHLRVNAGKLTASNNHQIHFGIRKLEVKGAELLLNGESIRPIGYNLVPDDRIYGSSYPQQRIQEDVALLKSLGCQMARLSHLPLPKAFLDELDRAGIMVFEEVSLWGKDVMADPENPYPFEWLERMITEKYNHPSVIGWSVGNEIGYKHDNPKVMAYVEKAIKQAKVLDPDRLAVYVSHSADSQDEDPMIYSDMVMINKYGGYGKAAASLSKRYPNKPIFFTEYGKALLSEDPNNSQLALSEILDEIRAYPQVIGTSIWTFNDYRSTWHSVPSWTTPPSENRCWGVVTTFREKKKNFSAYQREALPFTFSLSFFQENTTSVEVLPRTKKDFPYYDLEGYQAELSTRDVAEQLQEKYLFDLGTKIERTWKAPAHSIHLQFLDPQGISVWDSTYFLAAPQIPTIKQVHSANRALRVVFDRQKDALAYTLWLKDENGQIIPTDTTINAFIEAPNLKHAQRYTLQLVALNQAGATPSKPLSIRLDEDELPPIIWSVKGVEHAAMISYSSSAQDLSYEFRYGIKSGQYEHQFEITNRGVAKIPRLAAGKTYYIQMRRRKQHGFSSEWSHEFTVVPQGKPQY